MSPTHRVAGIDIPAPGTWTVDPEHTEVGFVGRHLGIGRTRGRFGGVDGTVHVADDPTQSTIEITLDMGSVQTGSANRDLSLRSPTYFDVDNFPTAQFLSTSITMDGTRGTVDGDLTIRGVTRSVALDVEYLGHEQDPWGNDRAAFSATGSINREDWNITSNMTLESGRSLVSKRIDIAIDLELIRPQPPGRAGGEQ